MPRLFLQSPPQKNLGGWVISTGTLCLIFSRESLKRYRSAIQKFTRFGNSLRNRITLGHHQTRPQSKLARPHPSTYIQSGTSQCERKVVLERVPVELTLCRPHRAAHRHKSFGSLRAPGRRHKSLNGQQHYGAPAFTRAS